jgi:hypothetical protein
MTNKPIVVPPIMASDDLVTCKVFLSRRNLLTLLSKLDRKEKGDQTACTLIKHQVPGDKYQQSMRAIIVTAVEDDDYYGNRNPGIVHPKDDPNER